MDKKTSYEPRKEPYKNEKGQKDQITCYECKKPGHIKSECPLLKGKRFKKKAMKATWSDDDEKSSDDEETNEVSSLAYMDIEDKDLNEVSEEFTFDELLEALHELHNDMEKIALKKILHSRKRLHV